MSASRILPAGLLSTLICLGLFGGLARAEDGLWTTDFAAAKAQAKAEKKLLLLDFTGSDWCHWCKLLHAEVFDKEAFQSEAPKRFVLVELDFPNRKKLPDEVKAQNTKLAKEYKIHGYPTVLLLDAEGQVIAHTGYKPGGPHDYMAQLVEFTKIYDGLGKMRAELAKSKGVQRARLLDQLIAAYDKLNNPTAELMDWSREIVAIDADNKAGLKNKYESRIVMSEADQLAEQRKFAEAIAVLDKGLAISGASGEQKQGIYLKQGQYHMLQKDLAAGLACIEKALAAAPESALAPRLKTAIKSLAPVVEAQEFIAKNLDDVEKASGLSRARLLDRLIEAHAKLAPRRLSTIEPAQIVKWRKEIIELDADGKAGLKDKYQVKQADSKAKKPEPKSPAKT